MTQIPQMKDDETHGSILMAFSTLRHLRHMRFLLAFALVCAVESIHSSADEVQLNGHTFAVPNGFEIELAAGPPLVNRPITADFDDEGRLYVSDSSGSNDPVAKQLAERPHRIVRLEDTDGDGRFDKSTVFADKLMFPEGTMWLDGSLYVSAPPTIWKLTDTDGDGVADRREEWFRGKTVTGCANDLHGPYRGPDGWIYWCKGAFAKQTYERAGKSLRVIPGPDAEPTKPLADDLAAGGLPPDRLWSTRASHIFRCRPDGSGLEVVMTGGMDNPVDVVFTAGGERIFTTTFLIHPGGGLRDGLFHAVYGGIYGKDHDPIHEAAHKWTGPKLMPVLSHLGAAAPCGLVHYESGVFDRNWQAGSQPHKFQGNLFACLFNMHKITRHVLAPDGATFKSHDEDFIVSSNLDFHPTDILEDADGSLVVVDTGGWYKLCCPTSQLHKPDILGAIYRVRRKDADKLPPGYSTDWKDPRGRKVAWDKLTIENMTHRYLGDERPAVRERAVRALAQRGPEAVPALAQAAQRPPQALIRRNAVWTLTRIDHADARAAVRAALSDRDETVRQVALHSVSLWRDSAAVPKLIELLSGESPHNQRAAAEALGRIGDQTATRDLFGAIVREPDHVLDHSIVYALIEIADRETTDGMYHLSSHSRQVRAAMIALDQMASAGLDPNDFVKWLSSDVADFKETATWIVGRHPEWGGALAGFLRTRLTADLSAADRDELERQLARFARDGAVQELIATTADDGDASRMARVSALRAMSQAGMKEAPKSWHTTLVRLLGADDPDVVRAAVAAARSLPAPKEGAAELAGALIQVGRDDPAAVGLRLEALAAVPGGLSAVSVELFGFLHKHLSPDDPIQLRSAAADVLSRAKLNSGQLTALAESLRTVGPLERDRVLAAFAQSTDERVGMKLVGELAALPSGAGLRVDLIKSTLAKYGGAVPAKAQELCDQINADAAKQRTRLDELLSAMTGGDVRRGQAVFHSQKAACASCHAIGYLGGKVGPDLTRIGGIRNERDLLESIVFPSASFVRSYEPLLVATTSGKVFSGVVRKDAADELVLATSATEETRIPRDTIEEVRPGAVSVMPSGLDQQLSAQELADLVAFLKAAK
jgi:putative membrane-bound dehydrogenase-like protein